MFKRARPSEGLGCAVLEGGVLHLPCLLPQGGVPLVVPVAVGLWLPSPPLVPGRCVSGGQGPRPPLPSGRRASGGSDDWSSRGRRRSPGHAFDPRL